MLARSSQVIFKGNSIKSLINEQLGINRIITELSCNCVSSKEERKRLMAANIQLFSAKYYNKKKLRIMAKM